jgi:hypothetical protein
MKDINLEKNARMHMAIIENHLLELYQSTVEDQRTRVSVEMHRMIQEKDAAGDQIAVAVLDWALERLLRSISN